MATTAGTTIVADAITSAPTYAYQAPAAFYAASSPASGPGIFDIRSFGAVADPAIDNRPAIQAAIDAAHAAGGGVVYVPAGTWGIAMEPGGYGGVILKDNVFLKGDGMGETVLRLVDGSTADVTGIVRSEWAVSTSNWGVADLTIDGNQDNTTGKVDGLFTGPQPGVTIADEDVFVLRVEIREVSRYGFDPHELTTRLMLQDCVAHDNGVDGFVLDGVRECLVSGCEAYDNGRHGFNVVTFSQDIVFTDTTSYGNGGAGFVVQRGSEDIPSPGIVLFDGGASYDNGREGILLQMTSDIVVTGMDIHDNGRQGIRIYGSSNVTIEGNTLHDNSQAGDGAYSEIDIGAFVDKVYGQVYAAESNLISDNAIAGGATTARYGIEERAGDTGHNVVSGNEIGATVRGPVYLVGEESYATLTGRSGDDTLTGTATQDLIEAGSGNDWASGQDGNDRIDGGMGNDTLLGGKGDDIVLGGSGNDRLNGNSGHDVLDGSDGDDVLIGDAGNDTLWGGAGHDSLSAGSGDDRILAGEGNDTIDGGSGFDTLDFTGVASGVLVDLSAKTATGAATGSDRVASIERVIGSDAADTLRGDKLANTLIGGGGDDIIRGAAGADTLTGGSGADTFLWGSAKDIVDAGLHMGLDHITDFAAGDRLDLRAVLGSHAGVAASDLVSVRDGADGSIVSAKIAGVFQDVTVLQGHSGLTASSMLADGSLLA